MPVIWPQIKPLLVHRTVGIVLACLNCHMYILFVVVFTLVGGLVSGCDLPDSLYRLLVVVGYY